MNAVIQKDQVAEVREPGPALTEDRNQCPSCGERFDTTEAFDEHRIGMYAKGRRRCLSPAEMRAKTMVCSIDGFWLSGVEE